MSAPAFSAERLKGLEELFSYEKPAALADTLIEAREELINYALNDPKNCGAPHIAGQVYVLKLVAEILRTFEPEK